jgi:predicted thioesterase
MVTIGIKGREEAVVLPRLTAKHIGSGTVPVLATPMMIALMEKTYRLSVKPYLDEGQETVGTHERFIIDESWFRDKMELKSKQ